MKLRFLLFLVLCIALAGARGAEDEFVLLTLDSNLIDHIAGIGTTIENSQQASSLIDAYHQLLETGPQDEVAALHEQLVKFIPGFEVAYTAADSAEITHIMSEMDMRLAAIQRIHAAHYTPEVIELLTQAYRRLLPSFGDEH